MILSENQKRSLKSYPHSIFNKKMFTDDEESAKDIAKRIITNLENGHKSMGEPTEK